MSWGDTLTPIAEEITSLLQVLPSRFRRNLADVCESHHKDNLDDNSYFPLCQHYGATEAVANVQYVAILLRTCDLLHITQDRTPSIMYKSLNISDLMGIDEWKKQMGTFSVHMKTREFIQDDRENHIVVVSADFDEERPFFVLTEYLTYANKQIEQNNRWAQKSQDQPDSGHYFFPWYRIEGDIRVQGNEPMPMRFELDRGKLLDLLVGHTIYNDPTVAIRELLQNSIDAVRYQFFLDQKNLENDKTEEGLGDVSVFWNNENRQLVVKDNGTGMDMDVIKYHLMTVGSSFYDSPSFKESSSDFIPISRFGIGILTCFMVSDNVEIRTWQDGKGYRIRMSSVQADYLLKELRDVDRLPQEDSKHGTSVALILRPSVDLSKISVLDILKNWVVMPGCDVNYKEDDKESIKIGFSSPSEALKYYLFEVEENKNELYNSEDIDIKEQSVSSNGAEYTLAYAVRRGYTPEHKFIKGRLYKAPGTCLEGIRVDSHIPGFKENAAILSVKGNRAFRTTVSRDRLEHDEEYLTVAKICCSMFQQHITDEVQRIKSADGNPLSQASTAGRWLLSALSDFSSTDVTEKQIKQFYNSLDHVITETNTDNNGATKTIRNLVSLEKISKEKVFWTIDARVVDYLGVISRDLGRELSFGEFLSGIAPDLLDSSMTPVVSDAHHYSESLLETHCAELVKFSKRHQQTAVKLIKRESQIKKMSLSKSHIDAIRVNFAPIETLTRYSSFSLASYGDMKPFDLDDVLVAKIEGDVKDVKAVRTRLAIILKEGSDWANLWVSLKKRVFELYEVMKPIDFSKIYCISVLIHMVFKNGLVSDYEPFGRPGTSMQMVWSGLIAAEENARVIKELSVDLPENIIELANQDFWFDATKYWLNWDG